jgi:hypothetical protein
MSIATDSRTGAITNNQQAKGLPFAQNYSRQATEAKKGLQ